MKAKKYPGQAFHGSDILCDVIVGGRAWTLISSHVPASEESLPSIPEAFADAGWARGRWS